MNLKVWILIKIDDIYCSHCLIVPVMDDCSLLPILSFLLELEVFLKDRGKTVPLQHARLMHNGVFGGGKMLQVIQQRNIVTWKRYNQYDNSQLSFPLISFNYHFLEKAASPWASCSYVIFS